MTTAEKGKHFVANTYSRFDLTLTRGKGVYVWDEDGKRYLDFVAGIAVNALGHGDEALAAAIGRQAAELIHVSNLYYTKPQADLAEKLCTAGGFAKAFFCNSGAEAVESVIKLMKRRGFESGKTEIVTLTHSFHGRTTGALAATGQTKYQHGFAPLLPGISHVPLNDYDALERAVTGKTAGVLIEPLQGEGGVHLAETGYLRRVRALCDERDILLAYDEVQCGMGRTGKLFAWELSGVKPDAVAMAKGLAGGVPMGAMLLADRAADVLKPGEHASTFGGNPLAAAAANVVFDRLAGGLLDNVNEQGAYLRAKLEALKDKYPVITDVRGAGLMLGAALAEPKPVVAECMARGLLLVGAGPDVVRFVPPLVVARGEIDEAMAIFEDALQNL